MSAKAKNSQAMQALFGNPALVQRLEDARIAVLLPPIPMPRAGQLLTAVLADTLGRLWPNIDFSGHDAEDALRYAKAAAASGASSGEGLKIGIEGQYDIAIAVGFDGAATARRNFRVGADGWVVKLGPGAVCTANGNPVGPAFAAALVAAQVFHCLFEQELSDIGASPISQAELDVRNLLGVPECADDIPLHLGETHVFGVGAVTHGLVWMLEQWPSLVSGSLHLVDQDAYGSSNGQRYAFMTEACVNEPKVEVVAARLRVAHRGLKVTPHRADLNSYCAIRGYVAPLERVIAGLDSAEARRQTALKLPMRAINMWTEGVRVGAGIYVPAGSSACLACGYLENRQSPLDEVAEISGQTGLLPRTVRMLLDSGRGLTEVEATIVSNKWGVPPGQFVGQPLRSVLPVICATGKLQLPGQPELVDVPFAFASLFAGVAGFVMLVKDLLGGTDSYGWTQHIFKTPTSHMGSRLHKKRECACCSQFIFLREVSEITTH